MENAVVNITDQDLPMELQDIAEQIGLSNTVRLVELLGGISIYIPKLETLTRTAKHREMYQEYKRSNSTSIYKELAKKFGYSESHARGIIREFEKSFKNDIQA